MMQSVTKYGFSLRFRIVVVIIVLTGSIPLLANQEIRLKERLRKGHPRLIFTREEQERIESQNGQDTLLQTLIESLLFMSDQMLTMPPIEHKLVGPRLLTQSRDCLSKVMSLSMAYRLSGKSQYAKRAISEMRVAAGFPDWNPSHFLDVAEMCTALAIGYDWLFDVLSFDEKKLIKNALIEKGLKPGLQQYPGGFAKKINNWNFVCNGGLMIAALAIADEEPEFAEKILELAISSLPIALNSYDPDGAWFEGPGYWMYGSTYFAMLLSALNSALGTDFGFSNYPGLNQTGYFFVNSIGPTGCFFNYSDCRTRPGSSAPVLFWFARIYDRPIYAWSERQMIKTYITERDPAQGERPRRSQYSRFYALDIAWFDPRERSDDSILPLDSYYHGITDVAYFRSSWENDALYAGLKGGKNTINHAHMDCGSFVFDALGQRWVEDLGSDNYNLPGYSEFQQDGRRWKYFRLSSLSHNVPTINGQNQRAEGTARIIAYYARPELAHAVVDLSEAYKGQAASIRRGLALIRPETASNTG